MIQARVAARSPLRMQRHQFILKRNWFLLKQTKSLKIKEINQKNPKNHFNLGIKARFNMLTYSAASKT
jgi:hypothetical protein